MWLTSLLARPKPFLTLSDSGSSLHQWLAGIGLNELVETGNIDWTKQLSCESTSCLNLTWLSRVFFWEQTLTKGLVHGEITRLATDFSNNSASKTSFTNPLSLSHFCCFGWQHELKAWEGLHTFVGNPLLFPFFPLLPLPPWIFNCGKTERMEKKKEKRQWTLRQDVNAVTFCNDTVLSRERPTLSAFTCTK